MSITVACSCGKRFKTPDHNAGRRARCSACGAVVTVPPAAPRPPVPTPPVAAAGPDDSFSALHALAGDAEVFHPVSVAPVVSTVAKPAKAKAAAKVATSIAGSRSAPEPAIRMIQISPLYIVIAILAVLIPVTFYAIKQGPIRAEREWTERSRVAEDQIPDQIIRAMKQLYRSSGLLGEGDSIMTYRPKIILFNFADPKFMLSLPGRVLFFGSGTEGRFDGTFDPQTMHFEANVAIAGAVHKVTGSASEEDNSEQLDGKDISVH